MSWREQRGEFEVEAIIEQMEKGRTAPLRVVVRSVERSDVTCECVVKPRGPNLPQAPLEYAREWIASAVAHELGIRVPKPLQVRVDELLVAGVGDRYREQLRQSVGLIFGSEFVADGAPFSREGRMSAARKQAAASILAFDVLVLNPDRRVSNPNLLVKRDDLVAFDHEQALAFDLLVFGAPAVETDPGMSIVAEHVLGACFGKRGPDLGTFSAALASLTDSLLNEIGASVAEEWTTGHAEGKVTEIMDVLKARRDCAVDWLPLVASGARSR